MNFLKKLFCVHQYFMVSVITLNDSVISKYVCLKCKNIKYRTRYTPDCINDTRGSI